MENSRWRKRKHEVDDEYALGHESGTHGNKCKWKLLTFKKWLGLLRCHCMESGLHVYAKGNEKYKVTWHVNGEKEWAYM